MKPRLLTGVLLAALLGGPACVARAQDSQAAVDILQWLIPLTGLGMTYAYADAEGSKQFAESYLTTVGLTAYLKVNVPEQRPDNSPSRQSYVSGHASSAFAGAAFIQMRYGWAPGLPAYAAAAYVGRERVEERAHYPSDVYRGIAIALTSAFIFVTPHRPAIQFSPYFGPEAAGIQVVARW